MEIDPGQWLTIGTVVVGWAASVAVAYSQRLQFEAKLGARFDALEQRVQALAGTDTRVAVLEARHQEGARRLDDLGRTLDRLDGNVQALATYRGVQVRQPTPSADHDPG